MQIDQIGGITANLADMKGTLRYRITDVGGAFIGADPFQVVADFARTNVALTTILCGSTLYLQDIEVHEKTCGRDYEITCPYSLIGIVGRPPGAYQITIDQAGGTVNVKAGRRINGYNINGDDKAAGGGKKPVNNKGVIGWDGTNINGVDIPNSLTKITIMFRSPQGMLNASYIEKVGDLVGFPNSDVFCGKKPGTMMYFGGNFSQTDSEATATFNFEYSPRKTNFTIGEIPIAVKEGWDVLSFTFANASFDSGAGTVPAQKVTDVEVIRPAGREWVPYVSVFGFGG